MTNKILSLALLALLSGSAAQAAEVTGKWKAEVPGRRGPSEMLFDLKADGEKLTGTISNDFMGESEVQDGKVDGDQISFKQVLELGRKITFVYQGKVKGDEIEFTRKAQFEGGRPQGRGPGGREGRGAREGGRRGGAGGGSQGRRGGRGGRGGGMGRETRFTAKRAN